MLVEVPLHTLTSSVPARCQHVPSYLQVVVIVGIDERRIIVFTAGTPHHPNGVALAERKKDKWRTTYHTHDERNHAASKMHRFLRSIIMLVGSGLVILDPLVVGGATEESRIFTPPPFTAE
jgi:hypothetical protein